MRMYQIKQIKRSGYLKSCKWCGETIYMFADQHRWIPFESWVAGTVNPGEWQRHECRW